MNPLKHKVLSTLSLLPLVLAAGAAQAEYKALKPGLWEIRTSTQMVDMPLELPPVPYRTVQCLTQEQLNNQENLTAVSGSQGDCTISDANVTEQRTSWNMRCRKNGLDFDAQGSITPISLETYTGSVKFTMYSDKNVPPMNGVTTLQGTWQGDCAGKGVSGKNVMQPTFRSGGDN